jgi:hypothetical protein
MPIDLIVEYGNTDVYRASVAFGHEQNFFRWRLGHERIE